ncbi:FimV/HubP family polar landmark protein [Neisseria weaveri]|uniref:TspA protein n=1 Tax=Neisseria weaveri TaxID=28091 RepID=A0A448VKK1_9NEIS|nr:FimV/HubP family polar landmark protein [Neisseria weaveri]EGV36320.1 hypothetical protein l13_08810 [Neisseria weaveri ATCC 51223]EGV38868.1 hypothetical protein l11_03150 [Neisseria weaveri LMG 5135]VEJ50296.1 TspA protein [Neisseria weaveri]
MKKNYQIKLIALSVAMAASFSAVAGLGGLNIKSSLGEPFSATVTVTGEEAKYLLDGGKAEFSDGSLKGTVSASGDKAVINIRSNKAVQEPVLIFQMGVGSQTRQYTAIIDPPGYHAQPLQTQAQGSKNPPSTNINVHKIAKERVAEVVGGRSSAKQNTSNRAENKKDSDKEVKKQAAKAAAPARIAYGGKHIIRSGETLTQIAARIRPSGLTTYQTVQALVAANPELFSAHNADKIWPGNVLNIPTANELKGLAASGAKLQTEIPQAATPSENIADASKPAVETQAAQVEQTQVEQITVAQEAQAALQQPEQPASAPEVQASAVQQPMEELAASEVQAEQEVAASEEVAVVVEEAEKPEAPVAVNETDGGEEGFGWWKWLLIGGLAGALALLLLARRSPKKSEHAAVVPAVAEPEEDETKIFDDMVSSAIENDYGIKTEQPVARPTESKPLTKAEAAAVMAAGAVAGKTNAAAAQQPASELEIEDDFDDVFIEETSLKSEGCADDINLDMGRIDNQQTGILTGALTNDAETKAREEADWDNIESTESVYEPDPEPVYQPVEEIAYQTVEAVGATETVAALEQWNSANAEAEVDPAQDDEPLEFVMPSVEEASQNTEEAVVYGDNEDDDNSWLKMAEEDSGSSEFEPVDFDTVHAQIDQQAANRKVELVEWEDLNVSTADGGAGFISESVGMTAPLEAKYELAKMYIEIQDPEAARDTLLELIEESDGAILAKAKKLLEELDA